MSWPILQKLMAKKITDPKALNLIIKFITQHLVSSTSTQSRAAIEKVINIKQQRGLPIGNLTSQLFDQLFIYNLIGSLY